MKPSWVIFLSAAALVLTTFSLSVLAGASAAYADKPAETRLANDA